MTVAWTKQQAHNWHFKQISSLCETEPPTAGHLAFQGQGHNELAALSSQ